MDKGIKNAPILNKQA